MGGCCCDDADDAEPGGCSGDVPPGMDWLWPPGPSLPLPGRKWPCWGGCGPFWPRMYPPPLDCGPPGPPPDDGTGCCCDTPESEELCIDVGGGWTMTPELDDTGPAAAPLERCCCCGCCGGGGIPPPLPKPPGPIPTPPRLLP